MDFSFAVFVGAVVFVSNIVSVETAVPVVFVTAVVFVGATVLAVLAGSIVLVAFVVDGGCTQTAGGGTLAGVGIASHRVSSRQKLHCKGPRSTA